MVDNRIGYGWRWARGNYSPCPPVERLTVATGTTFDVNGGIQNAALRAGDIVTRTAAGVAALCAGTEDTTEVPYGIVWSVLPHFDISLGKLVHSNTLPSGIVWGTIEERRTQVLVAPVDAGLWEVDCANVGANDTLDEFRLLIGSNMDHVNTGAASNSRSEVAPQLDVSTTDTTAGLMWRVVDIAPTLHNQDVTGANFKLLVRANTSGLPSGGLTGV